MKYTQIYQIVTGTQAGGKHQVDVLFLRVTVPVSVYVSVCAVVFFSPVFIFIWRFILFYHTPTHSNISA